MLKNRRVILGIAALILLLLVSLVIITSPRPSAVNAAKPMGLNWYNAAPYVMPLANNPPSLTTVMSATGAKAFALAFIVADGGCTPAWETDSGLDDVSSDTRVAPLISAIRAAGGDVVVSFGGYNGAKLGQTCGSAQATAAVEQTVINKYSLKALDFDLEEPEYENTAAINNELGAAKILQANNAGLYESITIPGTTSGTGYFGKQLLGNAKTLGYTPNNYAIMPFDGGFSGAGSQISALESFNSILMSTFGWSSKTAYAHEGITSMSGRTDSAEYFYPSDFQTVLSFAEGNHLARFTFWSVNRDRECSTPDDNGNLSSTCSSVTQSSWDFTKVIAQFAGATPPSTAATPIGAKSTPTHAKSMSTHATATPTHAKSMSTYATAIATLTSTTSMTSVCSDIASWNSTTAYVEGNKVIYGGSLWQVKWWSEADVPGGAAGVWTWIANCS